MRMYSWKTKTYTWLLFTAVVDVDVALECSLITEHSWGTTSTVESGKA